MHCVANVEEKPEANEGFWVDKSPRIATSEDLHGGNVGINIIKWKVDVIKFLSLYY